MPAAKDQRAKDRLLAEIASERRRVRVLESERALLLAVGAERRARRSRGGGGGPRRSSNKRRRTQAGLGGGDAAFVAADADAGAYVSTHRHAGAPAAAADAPVDAAGEAFGDARDEQADADAAAASTSGRDLLDVLDALQCRVDLTSSLLPVATGTINNGARDVSAHSAATSTASALSNKSAADGDPAGRSTRPQKRLVDDGSESGDIRLNPLLGGIAFTSVAGPLPVQNSKSPPPSATSAAASSSVTATSTKRFVLSGRCCAGDLKHSRRLAVDDGDDNDGNVGGGKRSVVAGGRRDAIGFEVRADVAFRGSGSSLRSSSRSQSRSGAHAQSAKDDGDEDRQRAVVSSVHVKFHPFLCRGSREFVAGIADGRSASCSTIAGDGDGTARRHPFPTRELGELSDLHSFSSCDDDNNDRAGASQNTSKGRTSSRTRSSSLTQMFRDLATFQAFDDRRASVMEGFVREYGLGAVEVLSADRFRIWSGVGGKGEETFEEEAGTASSGSAGHRNRMEGKVANGDRGSGDGDAPGQRFSLVLSWRWQFTDLGRGEEVLEVVECTAKDDRDAVEDGLMIEEVMNPRGLNDLVACVGGCARAVEAMLKVVCGPSGGG